MTTHTRSSPRPARAARPSVVVLAVLTGIAAGAEAALADAAFYVAPENTRIAWTHPDLRPTETPQVAVVGPWARTDYAMFAGPGGQGEVLLKTVMPGAHVFHHPPGLKRQADTWNHLRDRIARWHSRRAMPGYRTEIVYQRLSLTDGRTCVVFSAEGRIVPHDSQARPGLVYLGYFCARTGRGLTDPEARRFIDALRLRRDDGIDRYGRAPANRRDPGAIATARGNARSAIGNARFPFRLATPYPENDRNFERP